MGATVLAVVAPIFGSLVSKAIGGSGGGGSSPPALAPPELPKPEATKKKAEGAADQQRKRALAAAGRADTLLTGPQGLGDLAQENKGAKTLLGY